MREPVLPVRPPRRRPAGPGLARLAMGLALLAALVCAPGTSARTVIQLEAEDAWSWWNEGGDPIEAGSCASARNYVGMNGLDCAGDYIEWQVWLPDDFTFRDSLRSAGAINLVRRFVVQFFIPARALGLPADTLATPPGGGVWCVDAVYDCVRSGAPLQLPAGEYTVRLLRLGDPGLTRVDFLDLVEEPAADVPEPASLQVALQPPRPNPASRAVEFGFSLAAAGEAALAVHDVSGRLVRALLVARVAAGDHSARWDLCDERGDRVGAGVYFVRLAAAGTTRVHRVAVLP